MSLCIHTACKTPNTLETAEVICTRSWTWGLAAQLNVYQGRRVSQTLSACTLDSLPFGKIAVGCWVDRLLAHVKLQQSQATWNRSPNHRSILQPKTLLCEPPTSHTENSALSLRLQFLLQPFLPPFPQIPSEAGGGEGGT